MNNYQLYRTNVALGGQLKWDISIDNGSNGLYVSDFNISPISDRVPFNRHAHDCLLNYSHLENIKTFYKDIEGSFYQRCSDPIIVGEQPYLFKSTPGHPTIDFHDNTFDMGVKRAKYQIYHKTFEAFCPVWLEDIYDRDIDGNIVGIKPLTFSFVMRNATNTRISDIQAKRLILDFSNAGEHDTHTRFLRYLRDYLMNISLDDRIIKIDLDKESGTMIGVDASTGLVKNVDVSSLTKDMLSQERLLMDFDGLIIDRFATNHMIAKQLFNFNFIFDIEEFFPQQIISMLRGQKLFMDIRVKVGDEDLEIRDFYTNYEGILKSCIPSIGGANHTEDISIFEGNGLHDHTDVDLVAKNKMTQTICHWSLADNNEYIFNLYDGFAGYGWDRDSQGKLESVLLNRTNMSAPDIWSPNYAGSLLNNLGWVNIQILDGWQEYQNIITHIEDWKSKATKVDTWFNMCRYDGDKAKNLINGVGGQYGVEYILIVFVEDDDEPSSICWRRIKALDPDYSGATDISLSEDVKVTKVTCSDYDDGQRIAFKYVDSAKMLMLITSLKEPGCLNHLTFAGFKELLDHCEFEKPYLAPLKDLLASAAQPKVVTFDKILGYIWTPGPNSKSTEVAHYDITKHGGRKLFRLDGYIKPTFVSPTWNKLYIKKHYTSDSSFKNSPFVKYASSGYPQHYPSIEYFPFEDYSITTESPGYDSTGRVIFGSKKVGYSYKRYFRQPNTPYEYKWFTLSKILIVDREMHFEVEGDGVTPVCDLVREYLRTYFEVDEDTSYYIYDLYDMEYDWEYKSPTEIDKYVYTIKLVLK